MILSTHLLTHLILECLLCSWYCAQDWGFRVENKVLSHKLKSIVRETHLTSLHQEIQDCICSNSYNVEVVSCYKGFNMGL